MVKKNSSKICLNALCFVLTYQTKILGGGTRYYLASIIFVN
jgi:hypothetical protein